MGGRLHGLAAAGRPVVPAALLLAVLAAIFLAPAPSSGAAGATVVSASVPSAVTLDESGCRSEAALGIPLMTGGSWATGGVCTIGFGSSNDTARLRVWQRDEQAPAMESMSMSWTPRSGSAKWYAIAAGSSTGVAWASGAGGPGEAAVRFEKTTDGGATWTPLTHCNTQAAYDIDALSDSLMYVVTTGAICRSADGGATWTTSLSASGLERMDMLDATTGYAVGQNRIYKTTDGTTWSQIHADATFTRLAAISATPGGTIVVSGSRSALPDSDFGVTYSLDGGTTWSTRVLHTSAGYDTSGLQGAFAATDSTLFVISPRGRWRSTDSGATWPSSTVPPFPGEPYVRSDGVIFAPTSGDAIYRSSDVGATWTSVPLGTGQSTHMRQVAGTGLGEMWFAGYNDRRLRTTDAGASWTSASPYKPSWNSVVAWDTERWVVAGSGGSAVRTIDAGASLAAVSLGTTRQLRDGIARPGGVGVLVGDSVILRTTDYGASWSPVASPGSAVNWAEAVADDAGRLWIAGSGGTVASSGDNGLSWDLETSVPGAPSITALAVWRGQAWVGSTGGAVWRSPSTGALTWASVPTARATTVLAIWAIDATTAVALTSYDTPTNTSHVSRTTDSGATWTSASVGIAHARDMAVDDANRFAWVTGHNRYVVSEDRGMSWGPEMGIGVSDYVDRIQPLNGGRLVAVGDGSLIATSTPHHSVPDGMGGSGSGFGACLETAVGTATTNWTIAGAGNCTAANLAGWSAIAADRSGATATVATTATGATGTLGLRFGMRTSTSQRAGAYSAALVFEAVAPGA